MRPLRLVVLASAASCCDAYVLLARRAPLSARPVARSAPAMPLAPLRTPTMCDLAASEEPPSPLGRFSAWVKKWAKFDKDQLKRLGFDAFFTYGIVSNVNAGLTIALAWGTFSKATGLSPLVPGQWKAFIVTYVGIYATLGTLLRPFRFALAVGCTPLYTRLVQRVREFLPFRSTRPKLNRGLALFVISILLNTTGTFAIIGVGVWIAGIVTGVPAFPPGWQNPFGR